jgi:hypothetical protein
MGNWNHEEHKSQRDRAVFESPIFEHGVFEIHHWDVEVEPFGLSLRDQGVSGWTHGTIESGRDAAPVGAWTHDTIESVRD